jgi:phospholipid/cholesterol/gamma-HCH transport system ATP-binding protein
LQVGFLFQGAALYDSMTVGENIAFPLRQHNRRIRESEVKDAVQEVLEQVGLPEAVNRMSSELSGGMRKRIGLARTLVTHPEFMLYDEPTTGLDAVTAREISELIRQLQQEKKISSLVITHDMACARIVSDRIAVLKEGSIRAEGTYEQLHASEDDWVKPFFDTSF